MKWIPVSCFVLVAVALQACAIDNGVNNATDVTSALTVEVQESEPYGPPNIALNQIAAFKEEAREFWDQFLEDQKMLMANPFFAQYENKRDAGPFLNPAIVWKVNAKKSKVAKNLARWETTLPKDRLILALPENIAKIASDAMLNKNNVLQEELKRIDYSWMKQLLDFDHWELFTSSPIEFMDRADYTIFTDTDADWAVLVKWTRLRLNNDFREGDFEQALKEVRHLARLVYSTERTLGVMISFSLIGIANYWADEWQKQHLEKELIWTPFPEDVRKTASNVLLAYNGYFDFLTPDELFEQVLERDDLEVFRCVAFREKLMLAAHLREGMEDYFASRYQVYDKLVLEGIAGCRIDAVRPYYSGENALQPPKYEEITEKRCDWMYLFGHKEDFEICKRLSSEQEKLQWMYWNDLLGSVTMAFFGYKPLDVTEIPFYKIFKDKKEENASKTENLD